MCKQYLPLSLIPVEFKYVHIYRVGGLSCSDSVTRGGVLPKIHKIDLRGCEIDSLETKEEKTKFCYSNLFLIFDHLNSYWNETVSDV